MKTKSNSKNSKQHIQWTDTRNKIFSNFNKIIHYEGYKNAKII